VKKRALLVVLLVAGCSLPLPRGVQKVQPGPVLRDEQGDIQVLPPGPKPGETPEEVVQHFLAAQANSTDDHAVARQFLSTTATAAWHDDAGVLVYDPDSLRVQAVPAGTGLVDTATVEVAATVVGEVRVDGSYASRAAVPLREAYRLERVKGEWRLARVPDGLRLTSADRQRSYRATDLYYLAPTSAGTPAHLVPDQVFLPADSSGGSGAADRLVRRLVQPPSVALGTAVSTAFPVGTRVRSVAMSGSGVVTVDLSGPLASLGPAARQAMSAQLVWTLRQLGSAFNGLRLLSSGDAFAVPSEGEVQAAGDWNTYDPEGLGRNPPYYYVASRRLRSTADLPAGPATAGTPGRAGAFAVDAVAVTPDRSRIALLEGVAPGLVTVRTGAPAGPYQVGLTARALSSPTWGSGQDGLWALQSGRRVVLLSDGLTRLRAVTVPGLPAGTLRSLAVSRDGARAALVVGDRLYVGRVGVTDAGPRLDGLTQVLPSLRDVTRVVWSSGTELVALGNLTRPRQVLRLAVDGSSAVVVSSSGLLPVSVAAAGSSLVVGTEDGLYTATGSGFSNGVVGSAPAFPG
jgi:hypothetical protein